MTAILGIDAGTSRIKAVAYDTDGRTLEKAAEPVSNVSPRSSWSEQPMEETYDRVGTAVERLCGRLDREIVAVGVTAQGGGCWLLDEDQDPVRNAILWNDGRADGVIADWRDRGIYGEYFERLGDGLFPGMAIPILAWLQEHEPETLAAAETAVSCKDWIRFRLTGDIGTDRTDASLMHFAPESEAFDRSIASLVGVPAVAELEPTVDPPTAVAGEVTETAAAETGLPAGIPVVTGCMDVVATLLGSGAVDTSVGSTIIGTTLQTQTLTEEPRITGPQAGYTLSLGIDGMGLRAMGAMVGTGNIEWVRREIASESEFEAIERRAREAPPGADGLLYHPYLSEAGEKAPFVDTRARAQFTGLSPEHTDAHLIRAVYEGVALAVRDCYEHLPESPGSLTVAGGGARSSLWRRLLADCLDVEVRLPEGQELGSRGAAMLAAVGTGIYGSVPEAADQFTGVRDRYIPEATTASVYDAIYEYYRTTADAMTPVWQTRAETLERIRDRRSIDDVG